MATPDETFDPNDLDSIDALLDEAELEASVAESVDTSSDEAVLPGTAEGGEVSGQAADDVDDLLGSLNATETVEPMSVEPETPPNIETVASPAPDRRAAEVSQNQAAADADDFLTKRAAKSKQKPQMTAKEMDSIKKLIIIFGSVLIVLGVVGIGMGVWGAIAASSAGIDEETQTLFESIKVGTDQNRSSISSSGKTVQSVEKKLDALNFQLEQLAADLARIDAAKSAENTVAVIPAASQVTPGMVVNVKEGHAAVKGSATTVAPAHQVAKPHVAEVAQPLHPVAAVNHAMANPAVLDKITDVNIKMVKAQRRIDEVNRRVKAIQTQYKLLLRSVKTVEKQMMVDQVKKAETLDKAKESKVKAELNRYQYTAPDGMFYDQSVGDSYP